MDGRPRVSGTEPGLQADPLPATTARGHEAAPPSLGPGEASTTHALPPCRGRALKVTTGATLIHARACGSPVRMSGGCQDGLAYAATPVSMSTQGSSPTVH